MELNASLVSLGRELAFCAARVVPRGRRLSSDTTRNGQRLQTGMERLNQRAYPPEMSAIPSQNCDISCQVAEPVANCCPTHVMSQAPAGGGAILISTMLVIPACGSPRNLLH